MSWYLILFDLSSTCELCLESESAIREDFGTVVFLEQYGSSKNIDLVCEWLVLRLLIINQ